MRFCTVREADGAAERCICALCGDTVYRGEDYYRINGQSFCTGCLEDFARAYFAPYLSNHEEEAP